jgi:site-specific DNA-methyltransferase (adenine-specific)
MTEVQRRAYIIADNKMTELAGWDQDILQSEMDYLNDQGYDITLTGFELEDFNMADMEIDEDEDPADDDAEAEKPPKASIGDIYVLGNHRLMCGDSGNLEHVSQLMDGEKAKMVFTDPPYNVDYSGSGKNTSTKIMNDHMDDNAFYEFLIGVFGAMREYSQPNAAAYVCYASREHRAFENSLEDCGYKVRAQIIWVKNIASFGFAQYKWKHEPILYAVPDKMPVDFYGDRKQVTTWEYQPSDAELLKEAKAMLQSHDDEQSTVWRVDRDTDYDHPTQKPVRLPARAILNSSQDNDVVLDLFGGSGSTLIACEHTNRRARLMELDPKFVDGIIERWERLTGEKAVKVQ